MHTLECNGINFCQTDFIYISVNDRSFLSCVHVQGVAKANGCHLSFNTKVPYVHAMMQILPLVLVSLT